MNPIFSYKPRSPNHSVFWNLPVFLGNQSWVPLLTHLQYFWHQKWGFSTQQTILCNTSCAVLCLVAQLCLTLCNPIGCSLPGSSVHEDFPGKNTGVDCHAPLQGIFPTQGSNPGLLHCRQILYHLSHQGSPRILEWVSLALLQGNFPTQESNQGLLHCSSLPAELPGRPHLGVL